MSGVSPELAEMITQMRRLVDQLVASSVDRPEEIDRDEMVAVNAMAALTAARDRPAYLSLMLGVAIGELARRPEHALPPL